MQEYLRINRQTQKEYEGLKTLIDLVMAWRCAQTAVSNLSNVYSQFKIKALRYSYVRLV